MYVYMYAFIYVLYAHRSMHVGTVCMWVLYACGYCMHVCLFILYVIIHLYACLYVCMYECMHGWMNECMHGSSPCRYLCNPYICGLWLYVCCLCMQHAYVCIFMLSYMCTKSYKVKHSSVQKTEVDSDKSKKYYNTIKSQESHEKFKGSWLSNCTFPFHA